MVVTYLCLLEGNFSVAYLNFLSYNLQETTSAGIFRSRSVNPSKELARAPSRWKPAQHKYPCSNPKDPDRCMEYEFVHVKLSLILYYSSFTGVFILQYPIDLEQYDRREQLKKSGLGKVSSILSRSCHD